MKSFVFTLTLPSGKKLQLLIIFDTTGSMYSCLVRVRRYIDELCGQLFSDLGNVQIAVMAVGDYCDRNLTYVTLNTPLTTNARTVSEFITKVSATGGGDSDEAYELALFEGLKLNWDNDPNTVKLVLFVSDDVPHRVGQRTGGVTVKHDWREQVREYAKRDIRIAAVQCLGNRYANEFYRTMAEATGGYHLELGQFEELHELILGLCYAQESQEKFSEFTRVVEARKPLSRSQFKNFETIGRGRTGFSASASDRFKARTDGLVPVPPGRFQVLHVETVEKVTDFIANQGLLFVRGGVFYELTEPEIVQGDKKVVVIDRNTGDMFSGDEARRLIGAEPGSKVRVNPNKLPGAVTDQYRVFIQSRSFNRNMDPGTDVLFMPNYSETNWNS